VAVEVHDNKHPDEPPLYNSRAKESVIVLYNSRAKESVIVFFKAVCWLSLHYSDPSLRHLVSTRLRAPAISVSMSMFENILVLYELAYILLDHG
jgi:hypothetical protein